MLVSTSLELSLGDNYVTIAHGSKLKGILPNILTLKIKPPKLILKHLYENNPLYGINIIHTVD